MNRIRTDKSPDDRAHELLVAEEELILHAQMLIQRTLRTSGVSQRELAERMGVRESQISQMLGLSPRNLTLRTIARVMHALGARATLALDSDGAVAAPCEPAGVADAPIADQAAADDANAVASRMAGAGLSRVWGEIVELPSGRKAGRRREATAQAFSSFDPHVREMEMAIAA